MTKPKVPSPSPPSSHPSSPALALRAPPRTSPPRRQPCPPQRPRRPDRAPGHPGLEVRSASAELSPNGAWFMYRAEPARGRERDGHPRGRRDEGIPLPDRRGAALRRRPSGRASRPTAQLGRLPRLPRLEGGEGPAEGQEADGQTTAVLVDLARRARRPSSRRSVALAFSGDNPGFLALQRYAPESPGEGEGQVDGLRSPPPRAGDGPRGQHRQRGRVRLRQDRAATSRSSSTRRTRPATASSSATWTPASSRCSTATRPRTSAWPGREKGDGLAVLKGTEDKRYTDKVYARHRLHRTSARDGAAARGVYDPAADKSFPEGMSISPNREPGVDRGPLGARVRHPHAEEVGCEARHGEAGRGRRRRDSEARGAGGAARAETPADEKVDLVLWHHKDPRLQSQQQVQEQADKNFSYLSVYRVKENRFIRLADDSVRSVTPAPKGSSPSASTTASTSAWATSTAGATATSTSSTCRPATGSWRSRRPAIRASRPLTAPSSSTTRTASYFVYDMASGQSANITKLVPASFIDTEDDTQRRQAAAAGARLDQATAPRSCCRTAGTSGRCRRPAARPST
ncbi:MAG: hypothetical protein M0C28_40645 [Candidatus Moduliflexus flocculans]|nr:hypothetical protein [Candidatus Moduliflexus flocculans]